MASSTLSRLCAGSPMPMNTTRRTRCRVRARATCATISPLVRWRARPSRPVMQNTQPTAQPTCVETQTPSPGSSTLSIVRPSSSASRKRVERVGAAMLGAHRDERPRTAPSARAGRRAAAAAAASPRAARTHRAAARAPTRAASGSRAAAARRRRAARHAAQRGVRMRSCSSARAADQLDAVAFGVDDEGDEDPDVPYCVPRARRRRRRPSRRQRSRASGSGGAPCMMTTAGCLACRSTVSPKFRNSSGPLPSASDSSLRPTPR